MEKEITKKQLLLNDDGTIAEPGWARSEMWSYNRDKIKAPWFRIKEWDYYLVTSKDYAFAFTISDLGYISLLSVSFIDLINATEHTESELEVFPKGKKYGLGCMVSDANAHCKTKRLDMKFENVEGGRRIVVDFKNFDKKRNIDLSADLFLKEPDMESVYIATPWAEKKTAFYYNCKRNCFDVTGSVTVGDFTYELKPGEASACLDWGRGVWTYDNTWFWGTGSGIINGEAFGFNLGYGFSDRSSASENGIYYKGKIHKLETISFDIPTDAKGKKDYIKPWKVHSKDGRFDGTFTPILDRFGCIDFKVVVSDQHQVFGKMNGSFMTDDNEVIVMKDFICALEEVHNRY